MEDIALTARLLGALFYYGPEDLRNSETLAILRQPGWQQHWPCGQQQGVARAAVEMTDALAWPTRMADSWQRLFIGPARLPAPPWGSVYLDQESVLFGDSTLSLRHWMKQRGISPQLEQAEPEDHFGLLLLLVAWCAGQQPAWLDELIPQHILPWAERYLTLLAEQQAEVFYPSLAVLTLATLQHWTHRFGWKRVELNLYF